MAGVLRCTFRLHHSSSLTMNIMELNYPHKNQDEARRLGDTRYLFYDLQIILNIQCQLIKFCNRRHQLGEENAENQIEVKLLGRNVIELNNM